MDPQNIAQNVSQKIAQAPTAKVLSSDFNIDQWIEHFLNSSSKTVQGLLFFTGFYIIGVLCRRYLKFVIVSLITILITLKWLEYQKIATIDWSSLLSLFGIDATFDLDLFFSKNFELVKNNLINVIAGFIGFLLGYKKSGHQKGVAIKIGK